VINGGGEKIRPLVLVSLADRWMSTRKVVVFGDKASFRWGGAEHHINEIPNII